MTTQTRAQLLQTIAQTIADYRAGDIPTRTARHVERWINQFDPAVQDPILAEMAHVLSHTYFTKANVEAFITSLVTNSNLAGNNPCSFWKGIEFLSIQGGGNSQREMLGMFDAALTNACIFGISACGTNPQAYLYLDDAIFTGNRVRTDLSGWIQSSAPSTADVHIVVIGFHNGGEYYANKKIKETATAANKTINLHWWRCVQLEDRKAYIDRSDVLRPTSPPPDNLVQAYAQSLRYAPVFRTPGNVGGNGCFSSEQGRHLLEQEFLKAGVKIRSMCPHLNNYQRPLGNMVLDTLGFGSLIVTFRNCPNNAPSQEDQLMSRQPEKRIYRREECVVFRKTNEAFGGLSNMASGYPINIGGRRYWTSEALYQACRFPHMPDIQKMIVEQKSPMTAKMKSKPYRKDSRPDWDTVRVPIMKWCLRIKLVQNWNNFSRLLQDTGDKPIVEESKKDAFWGAKPQGTDILEGANVLGRLLMELRDRLRNDPASLSAIDPVSIPNFLLFGDPAPVVCRDGAEADATPSEPLVDAVGQGPPSLFDMPAKPKSQLQHPTETQHMNEYKKKLIEVALPLESINTEALRRKQKAPKGFPTAIHKYWAQRPISICRAVIFCQLVDDPSSWPERFPTEQSQEKERNRLFDIIEQLIKWENSHNELVINNARYEVARSLAWNRGEEPPAKEKADLVLAYIQEHAPPFLDPFSGGGSIPLEAQRLGLRTFGSDLNPVAVLISKALIEIPPKFAGRPPVNPLRDLHRGWKGTHGLSEDVRHYGQWMRGVAEKRIGKNYPAIEVTEQAVQEQPSLEPLKGQKLTVIAWLWARTVASPNPAAKGAYVPLVSSFMLSTKKGKKVWVDLVVDEKSPDGYRFSVRSGNISKEEESKAKAGTIGRSTGGHCILTGAPMTFSYVREQGQKIGLKDRLMAVVADSTLGRVYLPPTEEHEHVAKAATPKWEPEGDLPNNPRDFKTPNYGMSRFSDLFTKRQLVALTTFSDLISEAHEKILEDARIAGMPDGSRLADGGTGAQAYADAVATYLAFAVDRMAFYGSSLVGWLPKDNALGGTMPRQALAMSWDYAEGNPFGKSSCDATTTLKAVANCIDFPLELPNTSHIRQAPAASPNNIGECVISTDPPYYDNVGYADLSDFFFVWLRNMLRSVWPSLCATLLVPKSDELVATPYRHGGAQKAEEFFMNGMDAAIKQMHTRANNSFPLTIYYAFKQSEAEKEGISSTGWATFLRALTVNNLMINGTWPMKSEGRTRSIAQGTNALATSIVLVCRMRPENASITTRAEFLKTLKRELPSALKLLQHGNIAPVDMAQASIGPGMAIFTRFAKVLESDDSAMTVKTALQLINQALDEYLSEQEAEYDADTRFAITWFESHGMESGPYGTAETLATARGIAVSGVVEAGILEARGGNVRLLKRDEMPADWDPATDARLTIWECTQHLIRKMTTEGEQAAADLLARLGVRGEVARDLAYRLYGICERKKWADEGIAYNGLVVAWPELTRLAAQTGTTGPAQAEMNV